MAQASAWRDLATSIRQMRREKWGDLSGYLFVAPLVLLWSIFGGYPYIRGILITLQDYRVFERQTWSLFNSFIGLQNFRELLGDKYVWQGMRAACFLFVSWFPASLILSLGTAVLLNRVRVGWVASFYRVLMTLPWVIPLAAAMPMWEQIYEPNFGYLNHFLREVLGIWRRPPSWVSDSFWYWPAIGMAATWKGFGYYMLLFLIGLYNIPKELYEASNLDGANGWEQFWHIELPGIRNIMLLFLVTNIGFLGAGVVEMLTFGQGPGNMAKTVALRGWEVAFTGTMRLGYGSAINLFIGIINLALAALVFKFFRSEKA
jgi:ABC-type sugar transport system permease subunit